MRRRGRPHRLWLLVAGGLLVVIALLVYLVIVRGVAVPGLSERLYPIKYQEEIAGAAERYHVDPYLVAAVVRTESGYDPEAVSHAGAVGLMQLMPDTAEWVIGLDRWQGGEEPDLTDPGDNIELGACYLAFLLERFEGDRRAAIAAYNAGQNVVGRWIAAGDGGSLDLGDIQFGETRVFVERVEESLDLYREVHPGIFGTEAEGG